MELAKKRYMNKYHSAIADDIVKNVADDIKKRINIKKKIK